jgi:hypothetical protein
MVKAALWLVCTYLVLKFLQFFFVARPGFGEPEPGFRAKLRRGEPLVFIVAIALAVPAALLSTWYLQRGFERGMAHSADCYGRLSALRHLGDVESEVDALQAFQAIQTARGSVELAVKTLELEPDKASRLMADKANFYTHRYSTLVRQGDRVNIRVEATAIERCMSEPLINL